MFYDLEQQIEIYISKQLANANYAKGVQLIIFDGNDAHIIIVTQSSGYLFYPSMALTFVLKVTLRL